MNEIDLDDLSPEQLRTWASLCEAAAELAEARAMVKAMPKGPTGAELAKLRPSEPTKYRWPDGSAVTRSELHGWLRA